MALTKSSSPPALVYGAMFRNLSGENAWIITNGITMRQATVTSIGIIASFWDGSWISESGWIDVDKVVPEHNDEAWASYCAWRLTQ